MSIEKYNKIHDELIKKLEDGEITIEQAKEINELAFDKYVLESSKNDGEIPTKVELNFFNNTWNIPVEDTCKYVKENKPKNKALNSFIKNGKFISKRSESKICKKAEDKVNATLEEKDKITVKSYKDFKKLQIKKIVLTDTDPFDSNPDDKNAKVYVAICGEWCADPEHGFSLGYKGTTLKFIAGFSDVL